MPVLFLLVAVGWAVAASRSGNDQRRILELEVELHRLRGQHAQVVQRLSYLEYLATPAHHAELARRAGNASPPPAPDPRAIEPAIELAPPDERATDPGPVPVPELPAEPPAVVVGGPVAVPVNVAPMPSEPMAAPGGSPAAAPPAPLPAPPPPAPPPAPGIAWERWIGVRGAAALGASILVLAGIYFFEYSIEHGLITPAMRMIAGTLVGLACVLASELRLRRTHTVLANWLAGAGIGILYVAFWAGRALYDLYPSWAAGLLMVAVTGACVTLAVRRDAPAIAILGLLGGFATPLALSTGRAQALPLFSYVLLLDGAMLWVAYRRRWAWMAIVCLIATALYQNAWLLARIDDPEPILGMPRIVFGVILVAVFAVVFAALPRERRDEPESILWKLSRSAGVLLPLLFTVPLAVRQDLGSTFWPTAIQLVLLCAAACWVGARHRSDLLPSTAALVSTGVMLGWTVAHEPTTALATWQLVGLGVVLAVVFHAFAEVDRFRAARAGTPDATVGAVPAILAVLSLLSVAGLGAPFAHSGGLWPWLFAWVVLTGLGLRLGSLPGRAKIQLAVAALTALGLGLTFVGGAGDAELPPAGLFLGVMVAGAVAVQLAGVLPRGPEARQMGDHAAAVFALLLAALVPLVFRESAVPTWAFYAGTLVLVVLGLLAAARQGAAAWMPVALLVSVSAHSLWVARRASGPFEPVELAALFAAVTVLSAWPVLAPRSTREAPWAWRTAALAGPLYLLALRHVYLDVIGPRTIGLLAIALALVSIGAATAVRVRGPEGAAARRVALVWLTATAAGFVTLAIPLQLDREWITLGWALEALVLVALWRRFDHAGLKYVAFALAMVVCIRLVANPYLLDYYGRGSMRVLNWLSYTYLVPFAALIGMWALLRTHEIERRRPWERSFLPEKHAVIANLSAAAAILVLFVWVNLTIIDWFATGPDLTIPTERLPARDLSISIAWAVFALGLLAFGVGRRSMALRIASLALVLITSGKVFLYDLAHLSDLYRVASLAGLAVSLIVISLAYQRLVFRSTPSASEPPR